MTREEYPLHDSIRGHFGRELYFAMQADPNILCFTADLGYGLLNSIRDDMPDQFVNFGASEQCMIGAAIGASLSGRVVFCYSITTFLLLRPLEWHRNYLQHEGIPVRLVGSGWADDYKHDGITHQPFEGRQVLALFPRIAKYFPTEKEEVPMCVQNMIKMNEPSFLCLRR